MYTETNLLEALYANDVDSAAETEQGAGGKPFTTDREKVAFWESQLTPLDLQDKADAAFFSTTTVPRALERYQRGKKVLETCRVVTSHRAIVLGPVDYDELVKDKIVASPAVTLPAGHIATTPAYFYAVLVRRTP